MKSREMFPLAHLADNGEPALVHLVHSARTILTDPNVLLCLIKDLALLPLVASFVLGTGNNPMLRHSFLELVVVEGVGLKPTDLENALAG